MTRGAESGISFFPLARDKKDLIVPPMSYMFTILTLSCERSLHIIKEIEDGPGTRKTTQLVSMV